MWLAKLFGRKAADDDEPARFTAPEAKTSRPVSKGQATAGKAKSGFDPYNSGAFERGQVWERTGRR